MQPSARPSRRDLLRYGAAATCAAAIGSPGLAAPKETAMHLGIVTYNTAKDWDLETILRVCKEAELEGVEFRTTHAHGVEPTLDAAHRAELRQRLADSGLKQFSLGSICEFHSPDLAVVRRNIEECARFVQLAKDIGARAVKVRPNGLPKDVPVQKTLEQIGKALAECGRIGADNGVEIWMEVHGAGTMEPPNARRIMDACAHRNVGVTWNSNGTDVVDGSVKPSFELLKRHIRCCHITELWSAYPYREFLGLLKKMGYEGFTLCEVGTPVKAEDGTVFFKCYKGLWKELSR